MSTENVKLSIKEKIGYGLGDMAGNLYFQMFVVFLPIFYTDVFGIPAAAMGTMMLVSRLWDAINDPMMGMIADRTQTKWGKYRPYIIILAPLIAIAGVFTFTTPDLGESGKLIYAYVTYIILMMLYTAVNVPYAALMGVLTPNSAERASASQFRFVEAFIGQLFVGMFTLKMVDYFGGGNEALGWRWAMIIIGVMAAVLLAGTFFLTKERINPVKEKTNKITDDLFDLVKNKPWVLIGIATFFQLTFIVMRGSSTAYYVRYFAGDQTLSFLGLEMALDYTRFTSILVSAGSVATLVGALTTGFFTKFISKKNIYSWFLMISALCSLAFFVLRPEDVVMMLVLNALVSFFFGSVSVTQWAIYTDTADYGEWKFGRRATALIMAASLFLLKLGLTIGGAFVGWVLDAYDFVPNAVQSADTMVGIRLLMSVFPAIFGLIGGFLMLFYPLSDKKMEEIEQDLTARKEAAA